MKVPQKIVKREKKKGKTEGQRDNICWAFRYNKCPHGNGEGCRKKHPKKCEKFCDFGHIAKDRNGCDTKNCELLHPKLCRNSTRWRECPYRYCKFQHLQGTVLVQVQGRGSVNARSVRRNIPENDKVEVLVENLNKAFELMTRILQNSEMAKVSDVRLPDR